MGLTGEEKTWIRLVMLWLVLCKVAADDTLQTLFRFQFSHYSVTHRTHNKIAAISHNYVAYLCVFLQVSHSRSKIRELLFWDVQLCLCRNRWTVSDISKYRSVSLLIGKAVSNLLEVLTVWSFKPNCHCHTDDEFYRSSLYLQINC